MKTTDSTWTLDEEVCESQRRILDENDECIAMVAAWDGEGSEAAPEGLANARLIAAAPELLEAVEAGLRWVESHIRINGNSEAAEAAGKMSAAIAKATGKAA